MLSDANRAAAGLDAWIVPDMAKTLGFDPKKLQRALEANYPSVGESDQIQWGKPQWVTGDNRALRYRGNTLKREKMWFQIKKPHHLGLPALPVHGVAVACPAGHQQH